jgi:hypothetical protein
MRLENPQKGTKDKDGGQGLNAETQRFAEERREQRSSTERILTEVNEGNGAEIRHSVLIRE